MTKHDRAKMRDRLRAEFAWLHRHNSSATTAGPSFSEQATARIEDFVAREIARAVRAERKRQHNDEAAFARRRDSSEERFIEAMRELGRARACSAKP